MPPGWNGQRGYGAGTRIKLYLRGSKDSGFNVVEPNGFAFFPKPVKLNEQGMAALKRRYCEIYRKDRLFNAFVESPEVIRVLVVENLSESIEKRMEKLTMVDAEVREELKKQIDDLDLLDDERHEEQIESFRKQLDVIAAQGG